MSVRISRNAIETLCIILQNNGETIMIHWISLRTALALHARQIAEHGGGEGGRDQALLESALSRAQNTHAYTGDNANPDILRLAASYAYEIAKNHPFVDGNKRSALMVSFVFLERNGFTMMASEEEAYRTFLALAAGEITEEALAAWFVTYTVHGST